MIKRVSVILMVLIIFFSCCYFSYASGGNPFDDTTITSVANSDIENASKTFFGAIIDIVQSFCVGLAIIYLIVHAVRYMHAAPEGKAEIKKEMVLFTIGAVIVFAALEMVEVIKDFFDKNLQSTQGGN